MSSIAVRKRSSESESQRARGRSNIPSEAPQRAYYTPPAPIIQTATSCPCDGGCPRCATGIQPEFKIGQPNDKYEQEADRVADQVMRMPDPTVQRKPT